ncbi:MAG: Wzt carbohydrate-binding domain-containing protein, partial [Bdellovibrionales bacterium]|nr:Wzt carbohydrate-binding domain-containing protein [Bdellovibrionales bacterium]
INPFNFGFVLVDRHGQVFLHSNNEIAGQNFSALSKGQTGKVSLWFLLPAVAPGLYGLNVAFQESGGELRVLWRAHAVHELAVTKSPRFEGQCGLVLIEEQGAGLNLQPKDLTT